MSGWDQQGDIDDLNARLAKPPVSTELDRAVGALGRNPPSAAVVIARDVLDAADSRIARLPAGTITACINLGAWACSTEPDLGSEPDFTPEQRAALAALEEAPR